MPTIALREYFSFSRILEIVAVLFSIAYTLLITYGSVWCWPAAIAASIIFIYLVYKKRLLAETILHVFYLLAAIYGWITWGFSENLDIKSLGIPANLLITAACIVIIFPVSYLFRKYTHATLIYVDSFTTVFSIMATFMMAHMILENWIYWIVIDSVSIYMYARRDLHIAAGLFVIYTFLAINGFITWLQ